MNESEEILHEFIDDLHKMNRLYNAGYYTRAEQVRDELTERLDDIMRLEAFE